MKTKEVSRNKYPSDISRERFALISESLKNFKKRRRPRTVDLYDVFCGVLYVLKSGCQWRMIPSDLPEWRTIHQYYLDWGKKGENGEPNLLEQVLKKISWRGPYQTWAERTHQFSDY